jgi:oxygen-independent coproporphyrinogen III oxidase
MQSNRSLAAPASSVRATDFSGDDMGSTTSAAIHFDPALIAKMSQQGPRYTSYPTADRFRAGYGAADYAAVVAGLGTGPARLPLSLYLHIPFCESLCYY